MSEYQRDTENVAYMSTTLPPEGTSEMSTFQSRVTEVTIEMNGLHVTTVTKADSKEAEWNEAQIGDFHMSLFTAAEWQELSILIETAIREVTR